MTLKNQTALRGENATIPCSYNTEEGITGKLFNLLVFSILSLSSRPWLRNSERNLYVAWNQYQVFCFIVVADDQPLNQNQISLRQ